MTEVIRVKKLSGKVVGVIFAETLESNLSEIRKQMEEEIEEFLPKEFKFVSNWGAPVSNVQEDKIKIKDAVNSNDGFLIIDDACVYRECCESTKFSAETSHVDTKETHKLEGELVTPPRSTQKRQTQSTLTGYFGARSQPKQKCTTASVRSSVHTYTEKDIEESSGQEKIRRIPWNTKAEELCKDENYIHCGGDQMDKLLHEHWRLHKADLILKNIA